MMNDLARAMRRWTEKTKPRRRLTQALSPQTRCQMPHEESKTFPVQLLLTKDLFKNTFFPWHFDVVGLCHAEKGVPSNCCFERGAFLSALSTPLWPCIKLAKLSEIQTHVKLWIPKQITCVHCRAPRSIRRRPCWTIHTNWITRPERCQCLLPPLHFHKKMSWNLKKLCPGPNPPWPLGQLVAKSLNGRCWYTVTWQAQIKLLFSSVQKDIFLIW